MPVSARVSVGDTTTGAAAGTAAAAAAARMISARCVRYVLTPALPQPTPLRLLRVMELHYNEVEPCALPAWYLAEHVGCKVRDVWRWWSVLVQQGFLCEHPRTNHVSARRFTLVPCGDA